MIIRQAFSLLRQNPFFSTVSIIGTAVSIAFVMVVYMVYDIQTANIRPESHRDRMVYSSYGYSYRKADHSNANTGMSYQAACRIFADLPSAELVTYMSYTTMEYCGVSPEKGQRCQNRRVDLNFWRLYDIRFVAGRPFDQQEFDACADVVVIAGDIFDNAWEAVEEPEQIAAVLRGIRSRYGVYAVYGNHDIEEPILAGFTFRGDGKKQSSPEMDAFLTSANIRLLRDEAVLLGGEVYLYGRPDAQRPGRGIEVRKTPAELVEGLDAGKPILVLDHQPRELEALAAAGVDVDLCGHTHDGQMFPGNLTVRLFWENACGCLRVGSMHSIVTSGVGLFGPNMRVATRAEICPITIRFAE